MYEPGHKATNSARILNRQRLVDLVGSDRAFIVEVLDLAVDSLGTLVETVVRDLAQGNVTAANAAAHEIKGICANIGAGEMADIATSLQTALQSDQVAVGTKLAASLPAAYSRFVEQARGVTTQD
jgi:HPt (histidine-containing phosphotransfer) domain-containing protein